MLIQELWDILHQKLCDGDLESKRCGWNHSHHPNWQAWSWKKPGSLAANPGWLPQLTHDCTPALTIITETRCPRQLEKPNFAKCKLLPTSPKQTHAIIIIAKSLRKPDTKEWQRFPTRTAKTAPASQTRNTCVTAEPHAVMPTGNFGHCVVEKMVRLNPKYIPGLKRCLKGSNTSKTNEKEKTDSKQHPKKWHILNPTRPPVGLKTCLEVQIENPENMTLGNTRIWIPFWVQPEVGLGSKWWSCQGMHLRRT